MSSESKIIYSEPVRALADELRKEAAHLREVWKEEDRALLLEQMADRVEVAVEAGASATWLRVADAAALLGRHPETIRVRCRNHLLAAGKAKKQGGDWLVHVDALAA